MLKWEYVLVADRENDLADPGRGRVWFRSGKNWDLLPWLPAKVRAGITGEGGTDWPDVVRRRWEQGIRAFRSVASRLRGVRTRKPGIADAVADTVFADYLSRLRLRVDPGTHTARPHPSGTLNRADDAYEVADLHLSMWFQDLFASLVELAPRFGPVCGRCGKYLEPTSTGRVSRAEHCTSCKVIVWSRKNRTDEERRERWRQDQRESRTRRNKRGGK